MKHKSELELLLEAALQKALSERCFYVSCYLKPALETLQEQKEVKKAS
jgi:hypothetical protein